MDHIAELYRLYQGPLQETIGQHCQTLAPADWGGTGLIHLPWTWSERTPVERAMLQEMKLGGGMPPVALRRPGRTWLGVGLLIGLGLAAAGMAALRPSCWNEEIEENGFIFVRICPGSFMMGSTTDDPQADKDEMPAHRITLNEFWMSKFEVTNEQYRISDFQKTPGLPVTGLTWSEARNFCMSRGYRLPSEAEWEYAARAGTETPWSFGSNAQALESSAWFEKNSDGDPHPVGRKDPNPWGLHDMHGNVVEWVEDRYSLYSTEQKVNLEVSPNAGRVLRGGSFFSQAKYLRSPDRSWFRPGDRLRDIGFRCVRDPRRQP